jgi:hypothetical protein
MNTDKSSFLDGKNRENSDISYSAADKKAGSVRVKGQEDEKESEHNSY